MSANGRNIVRVLRNGDFHRSSKYGARWVAENEMAPNALWLSEGLCREMALRSGMRVLDMDCGRAA